MSVETPFRWVDVLASGMHAEQNFLSKPFKCFGSIKPCTALMYGHNIYQQNLLKILQTQNQINSNIFVIDGLSIATE